MTKSTHFRLTLCRLTLAAFVASSAVACSAETDTEDAKSGGSDATATDVPLAFEVSVTAVDPGACPGGYGCPCAADPDCDNGVCIDVAGAKTCSLPCDPACPEGFACGDVDKDGGVIATCVPAHVELCNPCTETTACASLGRADSACVSYGGDGNFCGSACNGDADCPTGYGCEVATHADGGSSLQCVKKPEGAGNSQGLGVCGCSAKATAKQLGTACWTTTNGARCYGSRGCSAAGLSDCSAKAPSAEVCDGVDNDCNGITDDTACGDDNPCTADACTAGKCTNTPTDGLCNADDSVCTGTDSCNDGKCEPGAPLKCDDGNPCTKDSCDPKLGCTVKNDDSTPCDADGTKCTAGDACLDGECLAGDAKVCDDKKVCTVDSCDPNTGECTNKLVVGLNCDDGDSCTSTDLCQSGGDCKGGVRSCDDGNTCTEDTCNKAKAGAAACEHGPNSNSCEDGNKCTSGDKCESNSCKGGTAKSCKATKPCTAVYCDGLSGDCVETPAKPGFGCDDGDLCTENDTCDAAGKCQAGAAKTCTGGVECTVGTCNKADGKCSTKPAADGAGCDDGDKCTEKSTCTTGKCAGGANIVCDDKKVCTADSCEAGKGCVYTNIADGSVCDDGEACNLAKCAAGACLKTKDICSCAKSEDCDDENPCTTGACGGSKCTYSDKTAGDACDDLDKCSADDKCTSSAGKLVCVGAAKTDCDDKEVCTTDSCDSLKGCEHKALADDGDCDDGSACTTATKCKSGKCEGTSKTCADNGKVCTPSQCDPADGVCKDADAKDGTVCNDGNKCTETDVCTTGKCEGAPLAAKVITLAGSGSGGYKDGKGAAASFNGPTAVTVTASGDVFVAEGGIPNFYRVRKIVADGTVSTWAGQGLAGDNNGTANAASFRAPRGIVALGTDLYVADTGNALIRKIDKDQKVTTLAGKAATTQHSSNDALYFGTNSGSFKDGTGAAAEFNVPYGIGAVGTGATAFLVVADMDNHRVRSVALDGTVTTLAGSGTKGSTDGKGALALFSNPLGIAVDGTTIYVSDHTGHRLRKIAADGTVTTLAGSGSAGFKDGTGTAAQFKEPFGLAIDVKKTLLLGDAGNHRIRAIVTADGAVTTYAGTGEKALLDGALTAAKFNPIWGVATDGKGNTYAVSPSGHALRVVQDPFKACVP